MPNQQWIQTLHSECQTWLQTGLIEDTQARALYGYYQKQQEEHPDGDRFTLTIFILGALLVGLGLLLYIASNLPFLGPEVKITGIITLVLAFNGLGYYLKFEKQRLTGLGSALLLIGAFAYGGGIWLIAQIAQIPYNYANGFLYWMLGLLPMTWLLKLKSTAVFSALLLPVWLFVSLDKDGGISFPLFLGLWSLITVIAHRSRSAWAWGLQLLTMGFWLGTEVYQQLDLGDSNNAYMPFLVIYAFLVLGYTWFTVGTLYAAMASWMKRFSIHPWPTAGHLLRFIGALIILASWVPLTFAHHSPGWLTDSHLVFFPETGWLPLWFYGVPVLLLSSLVLALRSQRATGSHIFSLWDASGISILIVLTASLMHAGPWLSPVTWSVVSNGLLLGQIIALIYSGYRSNETGLFRLGLVFFSLDVLMRYIDTFWDILPHALFFLGGGILLIAGGIFLEKQRRTAENAMKNNPAEDTDHD